MFAFDVFGVDDDIMPDVGVVDGVLVTVDIFFEKYVVSVFVCVGDANDGGGVGSGIGGISEDIGVLGFGVLAGIGPLDSKLGDGLGTGIMDAGLLPLLSIGVDGITELFRLNDGDGDCDGINCFESRICDSNAFLASACDGC